MPTLENNEFIPGPESNEAPAELQEKKSVTGESIINKEEKKQLENRLTDSYTRNLEAQIDLEDQIAEDFAQTGSLNLQESWRQLRRSGEEVLKKMSSELVTLFHSNKLAVLLRDTYLEKRALKTYKELVVNDRLAKAEDYDSFFKSLQADFWGSSKKAEAALTSASAALEAFATRFPERAEEALDIWPELLRKNGLSSRCVNGFQNSISTLVEAKSAELNSSDYSLDAFKAQLADSNDFVALGLLKKHGSNSTELGSFAVGETERRFDAVLARLLGARDVPSDIKNLALDFFTAHPEKLMADSRRVEFMFNLWLGDLQANKLDYRFKDCFPMLVGRIQTCSPSESKEILHALSYHWSRHHISQDFNWVLDVLPVDQKDYDKFLKSKSPQGNELIDQHILNLKKEKLKGQPLTDDHFYELKESMSHASSSNGVFCLSSLIANYPDNAAGLDETKLVEIIEAAAKPGSLTEDNLRSLLVLMHCRNWPDALRAKVFVAHNIHASHIKNILEQAGDPQYAWIFAEPDLLAQLHLSFHKYAELNDLRHHFYAVLAGQRQSHNLDDLITAYSRSSSSFDFEEIRNLFLNNQIDRGYISLFIEKIEINDLIQGLDNNLVSPADRDWLLDAAIKHGPAVGLIKALEKRLQSDEDMTPAKRQELLNQMSDNVLLKADAINTDDSTECAGLKKVAEDLIWSNHLLDNFMSEEEAAHLGQSLMQGALKIKAPAASLLILEYPDKIARFFPNETERHEYYQRLLTKLASEDDNRYYVRAMSLYFEILMDVDFADEAFCSQLEKKFLESRLPDNTEDFIQVLPYLNDSQKQAFIQAFEHLPSLSSNSANQLCSVLNKVDFFSDQPTFKRIFVKLFNDPGLSSENANLLFKEHIIDGDPEVRAVFLDQLGNWPQIDGTKILSSAAENKRVGSGLTLELAEVKKISSVVMHNRGLSPKFWQGYLASNPTAPDFYLDADLFAVGLNNLGNDCYQESGGSIIAFLRSAESSAFVIKEEDIEKIISKSLQYSKNEAKLSNFYNYKPALVESLMLKEKYHVNNLKLLFDTGINYSPDFIQNISEALLSGSFNQQKIDLLLSYLQYHNYDDLLAQAKLKLFSLNDKNQLIAARMLLLHHDLLDVEECRSFYQEITTSSKDNARQQILNSIDVIGSMLSNKMNIDQLERFFQDPRPEDVGNLREISSFMDKYSQESKGRSIAVMLFAREYLPDRPLPEVIDKVAYSLRKYEQIIEKYSYKNIPAGLRASIGMEYEITNSTDQGYQQLTGQSSLKTDIARLTQAARIGSGRDAVYEIATRPTDNPYLMLLEMKLLHDIEYIDFNFNRSPDYSRGARGFHLTIGGEKGVAVSQQSSFLQNAILAASWGGVQSGETGHRVNGGRGVSLRNRSAGDSNNVAFFDKPSNSVELRSLSIDKQETLQRSVVTAFHGAIAIQAFEQCFPEGSLKVLSWLGNEEGRSLVADRLASQDQPVANVARLWIDLITRISDSAKDHNTAFINRETAGYMDENDVWIDAADFSGEYNQKRFQQIITNLDPTLSLEEYAHTTNISNEELFNSFSLGLSDKLTKINNLYLKPGTASHGDDKAAKSVFKGDNANAIAMLQTTKLADGNLEFYNDEFLEKTAFDLAGEQRRGYYYLQGGSKLMLTHAVQRALLDFNSQMEQLVN